MSDRRRLGETGHDPAARVRVVDPKTGVEGRRGWLNRLATSPGRRGQGLATALVRELQRRLLAS